MGLCVVVGCSVLSMGPTCRRRGLRGVDGPYASSLCCQWVLCIVDGPSELSMGLRSCRLAYCFVDSPAVSSIHPLGCQWACYLVDWATVLSIRLPSREFSCHVVDRPCVLSCLSRVGLPVPSCRSTRCRSAHLRRHWARPVIVGPAVLSLSPFRCRSALCVVVGFTCGRVG